jgi:hypothetical protein
VERRRVDDAGDERQADRAAHRCVEEQHEQQKRLPEAIAPRTIAPRQVGGRLSFSRRRCSEVARPSERERGRERLRRTLPPWVPRCFRLR